MGRMLVAGGLAGLLAAAVAGCVRFGGPGDVHRDVAAITGGRYQKEFGFTVGRTGMALARWSLRHEADEDVVSLQGVRKVELGVYEPLPGAGRQEGARAITASDWPGWLPMVEMQTGRESILLLSEGTDLDIRRLLLVLEEPEELVIVRLTGDLGPFVVDAIRLAFVEAEHPELADPALERYQAREARGPEPEANAGLR